MYVNGQEADEAVIEDGDEVTLVLGDPGQDASITLRGVAGPRPKPSGPQPVASRGWTPPAGRVLRLADRPHSTSQNSATDEASGTVASNRLTEAAGTGALEEPSVTAGAFADQGAARRLRMSSSVGRTGARLPPLSDDVSLVAQDLRVSVSGGGLRPSLWRRTPTPRTTLLESVTFAAQPGHVVAVIGPSGAGKSTLVKALTGSCMFEGTITYNGRALNAKSADEIRYQIGYVPQEDVLHDHLTLRQALMFAARLRLPELDAAEHEQVIHRILGELLLHRQSDTVIAKLSGGERKRASVAIELITRPPVIFLDEPTTGLDPDAERLLFHVLRGLAHRNHTVIMITHAPAILPSCDRLLVIGRGPRGAGRLAFYGTPQATLAFFGCGQGDFAYLYEQINAGQRDWNAQFRHDSAYTRNVQQPVDEHSHPRVLPPPRKWAPGLCQLGVLAHRNATALWSDRRLRIGLAAQAPIMVTVIASILGLHNLSGKPQENARALLAFVTAAALAMGLINSCREIVKETAILNRERTVGLDLRSYLGAKTLPLAAISLVQAVLLACVLVGQDGPRSGVLVRSRPVEVVALLFVATLTAMAAGLAISATVTSDATALVMIPILLVSQLLLSGAFLDIEKQPALRAAAYVTPAYWTFAGLATSNDFVHRDPTCINLAQVPHPTKTPPGGAQPGCSDRWKHTGAALQTSLEMLTLQFVGYLLLAGWTLGRGRRILRTASSDT
jgi:ABC-type multidrug transport system ATPase subunit